MVSLFCLSTIISNIIQLSTSVDLNAVYTTNLTLESSKTYYVVRDVLLQQSLVVPSNVTIVFQGDYKLTIQGSVNIGCNDIDTFNTHAIGIANDAQSVNIYNQDNSKRQGSIYAQQSTFICNTYFSNLYRSLRHEPDTNTYQFVLDNNIFENQGRIWMDYSYIFDTAQITDNIFRNSEYGVIQGRNTGHLVFSNNLFEDIERTAIMLDNRVDSSVLNNTFVNNVRGTLSPKGIWYLRYWGPIRNISFNTFNNFEYGIWIQGEEAHINHNTFIQNEIGILLRTPESQIHYNNFINNTFNIRSQGNADYPDCNYNWNDYVDDISNPYLVSLKIDDVCDPPTSYTGLVTFWPYFDGPLLFDDIENLPALYTFNFTDCDSFIDESGKLISNQPTRSPSSLSPTTDPTSDPTLEPTVHPTNPTATPTHHPTQIPTNSSRTPTIDPTVDPTLEPTSDPTYEPTIDPTSDPTNDPTADPSFDPTQYPTADPTYDPTSDPTFLPTNNPTVDPTVDPTIDPTTDPTIYPTTEPTVVPTSNPTIDPTEDPTADPTNDPTNDPSKQPTVDPTKDPTAQPTHDPTQDPTADPTVQPTKTPTHNPSSSPTSAPTSPPTEAPLSFSEVLVKVEDTSSTSDDIILYVGIASVGVCIIFLAFMFRRNDDQDYDAVALYILQSFDLYSDVLLAVLLYKYYIYSKLSDIIDSKQSEFLATICLICSLSAVIPYFLNIVTAITIMLKVNREKNIPSFTKDYFDSHTRLYALGVLLNGGCYTTLSLLNSKLFNLSIFNSGLSSYKLREFEHFKIINTVILENLPQVIVQGWILYRFGTHLFGVTLWASFVTSLLSILLSVMVWSLRRAGNHDHFRISLLISVIADACNNMKHNVNGKEIDGSNTQRANIGAQYVANKYLTRMIRNSGRYRKALGKHIASYWGIATSNIQILAAFKHQNNVKVNGIFRCNKHESPDPKMLITATESLKFIDLIQSTYDIHGSWLNIQIKVYKVDKTETNHNETIFETNTSNVENNDDVITLLNEWNLGEYWNVLKQNGYEDVDRWVYLVDNPEKLRGYGFKDGHIEHFKKKYEEQFKKVGRTANIQVEDVKEGGEGVALPEGTENNETVGTKTKKGVSEMIKIKTYSEDADKSEEDDSEIDELVNIAIDYHDNL